MIIWFLELTRCQLWSVWCRLIFCARMQIFGTSLFAKLEILFDRYSSSIAISPVWQSCIDFLLLLYTGKSFVLTLVQVSLSAGELAIYKKEKVRPLVSTRNVTIPKLHTVRRKNITVKSVYIGHSSYHKSDHWRLQIFKITCVARPTAYIDHFMFPKWSLQRDLTIQRPRLWPSALRIWFNSIQ